MKLAKLIALVADALDEDISKITEETTASDLEDWDSLGHIQILSKLDLEYDDISEKIPSLASVSSIKEMHSLLGSVD